MAVIVKYPRQNKETNKDYFKRKNKQLTNLDLAKWAGWFDTDGAFHNAEKPSQSYACISLKDREPVELFSNLFESSLSYNESKKITPEPYKREYIAKMFTSKIGGDRAKWLAQKIAKFIINKKKQVKNLSQLNFIEEHNWTDEEVISYVATVIDGDGSINFRINPSKKSNHKRLMIIIKSSNVEYLVNLKNMLEEKKLCNIIGPFEQDTYKTIKEGIKHKYVLQIYVSKDGLYVKNIEKNNLNTFFIKKLINNMTISRKKNKIIEFLNA